MKFGKVYWNIRIRCSQFGANIYLGASHYVKEAFVVFVLVLTVVRHYYKVVSILIVSLVNCCFISMTAEN